MRKIVIIIIVIFSLIFTMAMTSPVTEPGKGSVDTVEKMVNEKILSCTQGSGHHIYEQEFECPVGEEKFTAFVLGTHSTYGRFLDLQPQSYIKLPVSLPVCPENGFVIAEEDYEGAKLEKYSKVITSAAYRELYSQKHSSYFLLAKQLEFAGEKSPDQWWLYLNATWEAANCGDKEKYEVYARAVISEAEKILAEVSPDSEDYWVLSITIPNMYRRIGEFEQAEKYFNNLGSTDLGDESFLEFFNGSKKLLSEALSSQSTEQQSFE